MVRVYFIAIGVFVFLSLLYSSQAEVVIFNYGADNAKDIVNQIIGTKPGEQDQGVESRANSTTEDARSAPESWTESINFYIKALDSRRSNPTAFLQFKERLEELFKKRSVTYIKLSSVELENSKEKITHIYFLPSELYIIQENNEEWNCVIKGDKVYEWRNGATKGFVIEKNEKDMVDYIIYLTDPAGFMGYFFKKYLDYPELFTVSLKPNEKELRLKEPHYGIESIYISEAPLWFNGIRFKNQKTNETSELTVSKPADLKNVSNNIKLIPKDIYFEESDLTLRRHMEYL